MILSPVGLEAPPFSPGVVTALRFPYRSPFPHTWGGKKGAGDHVQPVAGGSDLTAAALSKLSRSSTQKGTLVGLQSSESACHRQLDCSASFISSPLEVPSQSS